MSNKSTYRICISLGDITISDGVTFAMISDDEFTLTCTSTGGPATTVTWTRDSLVVTEGNETVFNAATAATTAEYTHTLAANTPGEYTCTVANNISSASASYIVEGTTAISSWTQSFLSVIRYICYTNLIFIMQAIFKANIAMYIVYVYTLSRCCTPH